MDLGRTESYMRKCIDYVSKEKFKKYGYRVGLPILRDKSLSSIIYVKQDNFKKLSYYSSLAFLLDNNTIAKSEKCYFCTVDITNSYTELRECENIKEVMSGKLPNKLSYRLYCYGSIPKGILKLPDII